jgi:DNA-binding transcriptional MerR regulator
MKASIKKRIDSLLALGLTLNEINEILDNEEILNQSQMIRDIEKVKEKDEELIE